MKFPIFNLDAAYSPMDYFISAIDGLEWLIAIAALLVVSAVAGIIIFTKKKNKKKENKE